MAQIQYPQNPVRVDCDDSVEYVTIWFERNNRIEISNHEEREATGKSEFMLVGKDSTQYHVIEPYKFPEKIALTLTGPSASGQFSVKDGSGNGGTYAKH